MRTRIVAVLAALLTLTLLPAAPARAVPYEVEVKDRRKDVKVVHSGFAGNRDIDIRRAYYAYVAHHGQHDLRIELRLRNARPDLETFQLYTTDFKSGPVRYRLFGNDTGGASLYTLHNGVWHRVNYCEGAYTTFSFSPNYINGNVQIVAPDCLSRKRVKIRWTRTENYYSDSMHDLAAWDRVAVRKRIGK